MGCYAGVMLLVFCVSLGDWVCKIPIPALVAIMIIVTVGTFSSVSIANLRTHPRSSSVVMLATAVAVVYTHNLAIGVLRQVLLPGIFFAATFAQLSGVTSTREAGTRTLCVEGKLFFRSVKVFRAAFDFKESLDMLVMKFRRNGAAVTAVGMNGASETIVYKLASHAKPGAADMLPR